VVDRREEEKMKEKTSVLIITLILNVAVSIAKIIIGLIANLTSVLADGFHSLSDSFINIIGIFSIKLSSKKADKKHPYGYEKYETIATIIVGCICLLLAFEVFKTGIAKIINPGDHVEVITVAYFVMVGTIALNIITFLYEGGKGKQLKSELLVADARETKSDVLVSLAVIAGIFFISQGMTIVDGILTVIISLLVFRNSLQIFKDASSILTDTAIVSPERIHEIVMKHPKARFCHAIRSRGKPDAIYIDLHLGVDADITVEKAHDEIAHEVKLMLKKEIPGLKAVNMHIEPDNESGRGRKRSVFKKIDF
jgi:cation diffusion facilitator family transporter